MKIFVTGTRGIPDIPGGVERHCQELYPLISAMNHEVLLSTRKPYVRDRFEMWHGVKLAHTYAPKLRSMEAIVHTFLSILKARWWHADIVHVHAVGPGLMVPLARLLGLRVVVTNHGPDYERANWGKPAKVMLKVGEYVGSKFANEIIVISTVIEQIVKKRVSRESNLVYNGVLTPRKSKNTDVLKKHGIHQGNYVLAVARFVPEKGLHDLIKAFEKIQGRYQLVIAGDADHETTYSKKLKLQAIEDSRVILTGYLTGEALNQVFSHARLFCLPSYHEGLPIALLEAMSYGLPVVVSDIPANKEVNLPVDWFFRCGDVNNLRNTLSNIITAGASAKEKENIRTLLFEHYNWKKIAKQTVAVYEQAMR